MLLPGEVGPMARPGADLGLDSLALIDVITKLEEVFQFEFEDYLALAKLETVGQLARATDTAKESRP